ncbi:MAG TPA: primosomal protein [Caulobacteraceae bacterium]|jgi:hypothetical protein|nr:primosomal protein [Caulobacteraceae bacterium]
MPDPETDADPQDLAETFDETNITPDGEDIATPDVARDVYDATRAEDDSDLDETRDEDFDPDQADEAELEEMLGADEGIDEPRSFRGDNADRVDSEDPQPEDYESEALADEELAKLGYDRKRPASD